MCLSLWVYVVVSTRARGSGQWSIPSVSGQRLTISGQWSVNDECESCKYSPKSKVHKIIREIVTLTIVLNLETSNGDSGVWENTSKVSKNKIGSPLSPRNEVGQGSVVVVRIDHLYKMRRVCRRRHSSYVIHCSLIIDH